MIDNIWSVYYKYYYFSINLFHYEKYVIKGILELKHSHVTDFHSETSRELTSSCYSEMIF